jgi:hypothetical protein
MSFFKRQDIGRVYAIKLSLPGNTTVYKIGMVNSARSTDRMMEILRSWFCAYRFVPHAELKLDLETGFPRQLESYMHKVLANYRFVPDKDVEGKTEMFTGINEFRVLHHLRSFKGEDILEVADLTPQNYRHLGELLCKPTGENS